MSRLRIPLVLFLLTSGVVAQDAIEYTKNETSGGIEGGAGVSVRVTSRVMLDAALRAHLIFSSGQGNREEGIDDQDYLDDISFFVARLGLNFKF